MLDAPLNGLANVVTLGLLALKDRDQSSVLFFYPEPNFVAKPCIFCAPNRIFIGV